MILLAASAYGIDSHGFDVVPQSDAVTQTLAVWTPQPLEKVTSAVGIVEFADAPLTRTLGNKETALVDDLVTLNLSAYSGPWKGVGVAVSAPVHLAASGTVGQAGLGDPRLLVPMTLEDDAVRVGVMPWLELPLGRDTAFLGTGRTSVGALASASVEAAIVVLTASAGVVTVPRQSTDGVRGGSHAIIGASAALDLDAIGIIAELRDESSINPLRVEGVEHAGEVLVSVRYGSGAFRGVLGGAYPVISQGVGAAAWRAMGGAGVAFK